MRQKRNETKKQRETRKEVNPETKNTETLSDSSNAENVSGTSETEQEIKELMEPFNQPAEHAFQPETKNETVDTENADEEFIPKRERKKRETKEEKKAREEQNERRFKLPGRLVNRITNRLMGGAVIMVDGWVSKNPIPPEYVYLDETELNDEDNVQMAEEFIKALKLLENPIAMYLASMGGLIITNYMMIKTLMNQAAKRGQDVQFDSPQNPEETK